MPGAPYCCSSQDTPMPEGQISASVRLTQHQAAQQLIDAQCADLGFFVSTQLPDHPAFTLSFPNDVELIKFWSAAAAASSLRTNGHESGVCPKEQQELSSGHLSDDFALRLEALSLTAEDKAYAAALLALLEPSDAACYFTGDQEVQLQNIKRLLLRSRDHSTASQVEHGSPWWAALVAFVGPKSLWDLDPRKDQSARQGLKAHLLKDE